MACIPETLKFGWYGSSHRPSETFVRLSDFPSILILLGGAAIAENTISSSVARPLAY